MFNNYKSPTLGNNISWITYGIPKRFFKDSKHIEKILKDGLKEDGLHPIDWHVSHFGKNAYTILVPLSESHLSLHTYYEHNCIAFGLYSCLSKDSGMMTYQKTVDKIKPRQHVLFRNSMPLSPDLEGLMDSVKIFKK